MLIYYFHGSYVINEYHKEKNISLIHKHIWLDGHNIDSIITDILKIYFFYSIEENEDSFPKEIKPTEMRLVTTLSKILNSTNFQY